MECQEADRGARGSADGHDRDEVACLFGDAVRAHRAGQLAPAEHLYRRVLAVDPEHADSLHYLGVLALQTGRGRAALDSLDRAVALNGDAAEPRYHLALALEGEGRLDESAFHYRKAIALKPDYAAAHLNLGNILTRQQRDADAMACYERVLALDPRSAVAHYNIANVLARQGRFGDAERHYRSAIACNERFAEAHNNLGNVLKDQGRLNEAEDAYLRALALRSDYAEAHNNLGIVTALRGNPAEARAHYAQAVRLKPDFLDAHKNLGLVLSRLGRSDAALRQFRIALRLKPDDLDTVHHLTRELLGLGRAVDAASVLTQVIDRDGTAETRSLLALCIQMLSGSELETLRPYVLRALSEGWARGGELEHAAISLIKRGDAMTRCIARIGSAGQSGNDTQLVDAADLKALDADPLLRQVMISGRVSDGELERVLTAARRSLLDAAARDEELAVPDFCSALARQCFINEYVFAQTDAERAEVSRLSAALDARLGTGGDVPMAWPMAVAAYMPLHALWRASQLMDRRWPDPVARIMVQQIREPLEERAIRVSLAALTAIDADSVAVQAQYEENPYPRWIIPPPAVKALTVGDYLRAKFPLAPLRPLATPEGPEILIAGCGSGSHAIEAYRRFSAAHVLAVDLSRTSLAYAVRKTRELGLPIDYAQADILRLGDLERTFDVIEANGSLQCLKNPAAGWRVLLSRLKPDGVMMLGLYSRTARQDINAARAAIAAQGCGAGADDIRRCRQEIFALPDGAPGKTVISAGDFYSTSDCRDLLFHVQEYQHTIPEIAAFLAAEKLQFLGFQLDARVLRAYAAENPEDPAMIDLDRWHRFECKNPGIFASMYQFAIQKA